jgi:hypothetical protein
LLRRWIGAALAGLGCLLFIFGFLFPFFGFTQTRPELLAWNAGALCLAAYLPARWGARAGGRSRAALSGAGWLWLAVMGATLGAVLGFWGLSWVLGEELEGSLGFGLVLLWMIYTPPALFLGALWGVWAGSPAQKP